ncbi:hypothetical protein ABK040_006269 [Willaertia magna]
MPSNNNMNINNNNNNNNEFNFIDETSKTREKYRKQRRMALKNIHKTKLRKQLQNNNLLVNYFEWNNNNHLHAKSNVYQYNLANYVNSEKPIITKTHVVEEMMSININQQYNSPQQLLVNHCHFTTTIKEEEQLQQQQGNIIDHVMPSTFHT